MKIFVKYGNLLSGGRNEVSLREDKKNNDNDDIIIIIKWKKW